MQKTICKTIAVIGEGITEKFYIESLRGLSPFTVLPQSLDNKASSIKELGKAIEDAVKKGYDEVYCLIDMDTKESADRHTAYQNLKNKYSAPIVRKKDGIYCTVNFIETRRCTELWFIYYFNYVTRHFSSYQEVETELRRYVPDYEKKEKYYKRLGSLHDALLKKGGDLAKALANSKKSVAELSRLPDSDISYSEMFRLFDALGISAPPHPTAKR